MTIKVLSKEPVLELNGTLFHHHPNGGGLVAETAYVDKTSYIGPLSIIADDAVVLDDTVINGRVQVYGEALIRGNNTRIKGIINIGDKVNIGKGAHIEGGIISITENVKIWGNIKLTGNAELKGNMELNIHGFNADSTLPKQIYELLYDARYNVNHSCFHRSITGKPLRNSTAIQDGETIVSQKKSMFFPKPKKRSSAIEGLTISRIAPS